MGDVIDSSSVVHYVPETWTESDTAAHSLKVTSFSLLDGIGADNFITSSTFTVGGCGWCIKFCPDGAKQEAGDGDHYASAYLYFCRGEPGVETKYTLSVLDQHGQVSEQVSIGYSFEAIDLSWGCLKFIKKSKLQRLASLNQDGFTIRCVLTVMKKYHYVEDVSAYTVPMPPSNLREDFGKMLKDKEGADVTFSVGERSFYVHRRVLAARSPVFKVELSDDLQMKGSGRRHIKIDDMEPSVFEALLHFVYTDALPDDRDVEQNAMLQHLLVAAELYRLDRLVTICEGKLCQSIDVETIASTLTIAEQHGRLGLKNACIGFVSSQDVFRAVKQTDGFKHLMASCPSVMADILEQKLPASGVMVDILEQKLPPSEVPRSQPSLAPGPGSWVRRVVLRSVGVLAVVASVGFITSSRSNGFRFTRGANDKRGKPADWRSAVV